MIDIINAISDIMEEATRGHPKLNQRLDILKEIETVFLTKIPEQTAINGQGYQYSHTDDNGYLTWKAPNNFLKTNPQAPVEIKLNKEKVVFLMITSASLFVKLNYSIGNIINGRTILDIKYPSTQYEKLIYVTDKGNLSIEDFDKEVLEYFKNKGYKFEIFEERSLNII